MAHWIEGKGWSDNCTPRHVDSTKPPKPRYGNEKRAHTHQFTIEEYQDVVLRIVNSDKPFGYSASELHRRFGDGKKVDIIAMPPDELMKRAGYEFSDFVIHKREYDYAQKQKEIAEKERNFPFKDGDRVEFIGDVDMCATFRYVDICIVHDCHSGKCRITPLKWKEGACPNWDWDLIVDAEEAKRNFKLVYRKPNSHD